MKQRKFKWIHEAEYKEEEIEKLIVHGYMKIPRERIVNVPNEVYGKKSSRKVRSPVAGTKIKQQQGKHRQP